MPRATLDKWTADRVAGWSGRLLASALLLMFLVLALGHRQLPPLTWSSSALGVVLVGLALAWWNDAGAGGLILGGMGAFYGLNCIASGQWPGGCVFPWFFLAGMLLVISACLRLRRTQWTPWTSPT